jgi:curved DNA-binding protein
MEYRDYYKILEVSRTATPEEIKKSYRKLARRFHPDVSKEKNAEARFKEVQEAYEVLKDPEKRAAYDELGSDFRGGQPFRPPPDWAREFGSAGRGRGRGRRTSHEDAGFSDFFSSLFGGDPNFSGGRGFAGRGDDQRAVLELSLEDAFAGTSRQVSLEAPQRDESGAVTVRERTLKVQIPAGVTEGQTIRLAGQGGGGSGGGAAGDLLLEVRLLPHRLYRVEGRDVTLELPVAPWEAALGANVSTPTLGGAVDLRVPAGARSGQKLRLRGRGLPGEPAGDQYVVLKIVLPPAADDAARAFYERMRKELPFDPRAGL